MFSSSARIFLFKPILALLLKTENGKQDKDVFGYKIKRLGEISNPYAGTRKLLGNK